MKLSRFHRFFLVIMTGMMVLSGVVTTFSPALASGPGKNPSGTTDKEIQEQFARQSAIRSQYEPAILAMEQHIYVTDDGLLALDIESGKAIGVADPVYNHLAQAMEHTNELLQAGKISLSEVSLDSAINTTSSADPNACQGITRNPIYYWWGYRQYLNSCRTKDLIFAMTVGAAVCGFLSGGLCAVVLGVGVGYITWLNDRWGRGIYAQITWLNVGYVWHQ